MTDSDELKNIDATVLEELFEPNFVAQALQIQPTTLRKYALLAERVTDDLERYRHNVTHNDSRQYTQADIDDFKKIIKLKNVSGITLENAVKSVLLDDDKTGDIKRVALQDTKKGTDHNAIYSVTLDQLVTQNKIMLNQLKSQQQTLENKEQQIEKLASLLQETTDALNKNNHLIEQMQTQKNGFWSRIFKKD